MAVLATLRIVQRMAREDDRILNLSVLLPVLAGVWASVHAEPGGRRELVEDAAGAPADRLISESLARQYRHVDLYDAEALATHEVEGLRTEMRWTLTLIDALQDRDVTGELREFREALALTIDEEGA